MRFLHTADLHLDSPLRSQALRNPSMGTALRSASRQVLERLVDVAIEEQVDAVLFAGDTFDNGVADVASRAALAGQLARLAVAGIPAVMIQGNHDALLDFHRYGPVSDGLTLLTPDAPTLRIGDASLHGIGFSARHVSESLLPRYPLPEPGRYNLGLMHSSLDGAVGHDPYAPCALSDLFAQGYDYWALGHVHKRAVHEQDGRVVVMPGIPQGRSIRETEGGSATLVTLDLDGVHQRTVPLELLRFAHVPVDLSGADTQTERDEALRAALRGAVVEGVLVSARLHARGTAEELGDPRMLEAQAREAGEAMEEIFVESLRVVPVTATGDTSEAAGDLTRMMQEDAAAPGFRDEVTAAVAELRAALPAEIRDALEDGLMDALIEEGIAEMSLRLAAGGRGQ